MIVTYIAMTTEIVQGKHNAIEGEMMSSFLLLCI